VTDLLTNKRLFAFHGVFLVLRNYGDFYLSFGTSISFSCIYACHVRSMNLNAESKQNLNVTKYTVSNFMISKKKYSLSGMQLRVSCLSRSLYFFEIPPPPTRTQKVY
jgi:hypothetical protein